MKMADAKQKRNEQLKRWIGSETDLEPPVVKRQKTKVKFDDGAVFLAACSSGDTDEVLKLLHRGADINYANVDGLTALHQVCAPRRRFPDAAGPRRPPTGPASAPGLPSLGAAGDAAAAEGAASRLGGRENWCREAPGRRPLQAGGGGGANRVFPGRRGEGTARLGAQGRLWTCVWGLGSRRGGVQ